MSVKTIVSIVNPGAAPADNGRTIHALKLASGLAAGGADVKVVFAGEGVKWVPRFEKRTEDSHPFVKHYGHVYDEVRDLVVVCNMCCIRFEALDEVRELGLPILGEGREHADFAAWVLDGYQVIHH